MADGRAEFGCLTLQAAMALRSAHQQSHFPNHGPNIASYHQTLIFELQGKEPIMADDLEPFREWFRTWGTCVAAVDFESARPLFAAEVVGFGTHAAFVSGLDALQAEQWSKIWPNISDFAFLVDKLVGAASGTSAWAAVPWTSRGYHQDGTSYNRPGRATVTFRKDADLWLGTHTHFSLLPGVPHRTFGKP
jgi:ketosteroid isomerase-like protein